MPTPFSIVRRTTRSLKFSMLGGERAFQHIYDTRYWGERESVSGPGSSLANTAKIRKELPRIVEKYGIVSMIDAPCGDLYWMSLILEEMGIDYQGGDIVPEVVENARQRNTYPKANFSAFDIRNDSFPDCDLWLCRDVLFHFSYTNIRKTLDNFKSSNVKYLMVSSNTNDGVANRPIVTGDYRELNLFKKPLNFPSDKVLERFGDSATDAAFREIVLFKREDILDAELVL